MSVPLIVLVGATASGKSRLAVQLAHCLHAQGRACEIINADSMCIYRGMDIGTAKPTMAEREGIPHHLLDILEVYQDASVAEFQQMARRSIADLRARSIIPIIVGGSSLYNRAITDHFDFPGTDPQRRAYWNEQLEIHGSHYLHDLLGRRCPEAADGILPGNGRRIVRALEVIDLTGSFSSSLPDHVYALDDVIQWGIAIERSDLDEAIERRVDMMLDEGLVDEVKSLIDQGLREGKTAQRGLGYRQILEYLDSECSLEQARDNTVVATRRFSRKQLMWYRKDPRIQWFERHEDTAKRMLSHLQRWEDGR